MSDSAQESQKRHLSKIRPHGLGMEACVTLGMLQPHQAERLATAGLTAYNHNLDTGPDFYGQIVTTRSYADRLDTLATVRSFGIDLCCGGIIGMGETIQDRAAMLQVLAAIDPHPESVPINALVPVKGTPLANRPRIDQLDFVRMVAAAPILDNSTLRGPIIPQSRSAVTLYGSRCKLGVLRRYLTYDPQCRPGGRCQIVRRDCSTEAH